MIDKETIISVVKFVDQQALKYVESHRSDSRFTIDCWESDLLPNGEDCIYIKTSYISSCCGDLETENHSITYETLLSQ